ncbi:GGDEF domain-containing protein [Ferrimonas balearica]|uniref:GGDEF domain-containing protein n=1 Tax=Ferrimonas balearica TaxID=44012 RepID=UPI001C99B059|nr:GGDEF domain-containing protein [Ferrimonas balearica]MBY5991633.1 GGDEF domain-containing protein [Ferrimonas balearica]
MTRELSPILWCALVVTAVTLGLPWWQAQLDPHALSVELMPFVVLLITVILAWRFRLAYHSYLGLLLWVAYPFQAPFSGLEQYFVLSNNDIYLLLALNLLWLPSTPPNAWYLLGWGGWLVGQCLLLQSLSWHWLEPHLPPALVQTPMHYLFLLPATRYFLGLMQGRSEMLTPLLLGAMAWLVSGWPMPWPGAVLLYAGISALLMLSVFDGAYRLAFRDGLTGLPARRTLDGDLEHAAQRTHIAMIDVDHFKEFNDNHGHNWGDNALRLLASQLRKVRGARAYRYGGEEFTLVFKRASRAEVEAALQKLQGALNAQTMIIPQPKNEADEQGSVAVRAQFTVSIGVAQRHGPHELVASVIKRADRALYRAKEEGRNRAVWG